MNEMAYILYKEDWVREHISKECLLQTMRDYSDYTDDCVVNHAEFNSYEDWLQENGFSGTGGMVYASFDEFDDNEYEDGEYMKYLLSKDDFEFWCSEREYMPEDFEEKKSDNEVSILVTAYPYASQNGYISVPKELLSDNNELTCYISDHLSDVKYYDTALDYAGTDFEFEVEE